MDWQDEGVILSARRFGERDAIVSIMTFEHGRHAGLVRGGAIKRGVLQPGNHVTCEWRARLSDHLGAFRIEPVAVLRVSVIDDPLRLTAVGSICALVDQCVGERDAHPVICAATISLIRRIGEAEDWLADMPRFELLLLAELGFALELQKCALGGPSDHLAFVSPRTGRAVSRDKAGDYAPKLLPLPRYLIADTDPDKSEIINALRLTGHFLARNLYDPTDKPLPLARERLMDYLSADVAQSNQQG